MSRQGRTRPSRKRQVAPVGVSLTGGNALFAFLAGLVRAIRLRAARAWRLADEAVLRTPPATARGASEDATTTISPPTITTVSHGGLRLIGYVAALACGVLAQMQAAQGALVAVPLFALGGALLVVCSFRIPLSVPPSRRALGKEPARSQYCTSAAVTDRLVPLGVALFLLAAAIAACVLAAGDTNISLSAQPLVLYFTSIVLLVLGAVLLDRYFPSLSRNIPHRFTRADMLLLLVVAAAAVFFRFYELNHIPWYIEDDESSNLGNAVAIVQGWLYSPFASGNNDTPYLHMYAIALALKVFSDHQVALKSVGALLGVLTVVAEYVTVRSIFGTFTAFVASFLMSISYWPVLISRFGYHWAVNGALELLVIYWLVAALRSGRLLHFSFAGGALGLCIYFTSAAALTPLAVVLFGCFLLVSRCPIPKRRALFGFAMLCIGTLLVSAPRISMLHMHPEMWGRHMYDSVFTGPSRPNAYSVITRQAGEMLASFNYQSDEEARFHPVPGMPLLDPLMGVLFGLGLAYSLYKVFSVYFTLILLMFFASLLPAITSTGESYWATAYRSSAVVGPLFALSAVPISLVWVLVKKRRTGRILLILLLLLLAIYEAFTNYNTYFHEFADSPYWHSGRIATISSSAAQINATPSTYRILLDSTVESEQVADLIYGRRVYEPIHWLDNEPIPSLLQNPLKPTLILGGVQRDTWHVAMIGDTLTDMLGHYYPGGTRRDVRSQTGSDLTSSYMLQPAAIIQAHGLTCTFSGAGRNVVLTPLTLSWNITPVSRLPLTAHLTGTLIVPSEGAYSLSVSGSTSESVALNGRPFSHAYLEPGLYDLDIHATFRRSGQAQLLWTRNGVAAPVPLASVLRKSLPPWGLMESYTVKDLDLPVWPRWAPAVWYSFAVDAIASRSVQEINWTADVFATTTGNYQLSTLSAPPNLGARVAIDSRYVLLMPGVSGSWQTFLKRGWHHIGVTAKPGTFRDYHLFWVRPDKTTIVLGGLQSRRPTP